MVFGVDVIVGEVEFFGERMRVGCLVVVEDGRRKMWGFGVRMNNVVVIEVGVDKMVVI